MISEKMAKETEENIPFSSVNPQYLHANSTTHTWAFSAIAELIDNAYDPDVGAKQIRIDWTKIKDLDCLTFTDNGAGMDFDKMHKMLSFGFSNKQALEGRAPVGLYGNGFKSGSMFLGKDAIVFSKNIDSMTVGLLSQTYLADIQAQNVVVPIVTFTKNEENKFSAIPQHRRSLKAILEHSLFQTEEQLLHELKIIKGLTGTRIIIWNLRSATSGQIEFEFKEDIKDIQIPYVDSTDEQRRPIQCPAWVAEFEFSLRANAKGVGVIGVIECNFLKPTHNKQEFADSEEYRKIKHNIGVKLEEYWEEIQHKTKENPSSTESTDNMEGAAPDQTWVQCNDCLKWRKLADDIDPESLPDVWVCPMNNNPKFRTCWIEEPEDSNEKKYEKNYKKQQKKKQKVQKKKGRQNSEDSESTPKTSATPLKRYDTRQRRGDALTSPTSSSSSPLSFSGDDPSFDTVLSTYTVPENPSSRQKRKLITQENKEGKRAKMIGHQNDTSEAVASTAASALRLPTSPVTATLDKNSMQVQTATLEGDQCSEQVETVKQERDQHSEQVETVKQERDQHSEQMEAVTWERDQYREQVKTVTQERDQYREQMETVTQERDQYREQVKTVIRERDRYRNHVKTVTQERNQYREEVEAITEEREQYREQMETVTQERDQYREQVKTVTQERDQYREQMETVTQERDQYREQVKNVIRTKDRYRNQVKAVTQERNQYREQVEAVTEERDQYREQMETITQERDQYREQVKTITQERDQYKTKAFQPTMQMLNLQKQILTTEKDELKSKTV